MVMHKTSNFVVRTVYDKKMLSQSKELGSMTFSVSQRVYLPTFLNFFLKESITLDLVRNVN